MSRRFAFVVAIAFSALVVTSGSSAAPSDLFFSEYIEGTSNNKALEIYNGTGAAIDLTAGAYSVQMYFNGSATAGLTITLDGDRRRRRRIRARASRAERDDPRPGRPDERRRLVQRRRRGRPAQGRRRTILDVVGQVGVDPGTEWGTRLASTADNTLRRKAAVGGRRPRRLECLRPLARMGRLRNRRRSTGLGAHRDRRSRRRSATHCTRRPARAPLATRDPSR